MNDIKGLVPFQAEDALDGTQAFLTDKALQQVKTAYTTAVAVQQPRAIAKVANNVLAEAALAGSSFYYRWEVKSRGRKVPIQGPSIDLAMCIARNYGNCAVDIEATETETHFLLKGIFIDLETGFTVPRLFRQRKKQDIGGGYDADRAEDIVFQIAQSKAQGNAIIKAMPAWLVDKAIETARKAEIDGIKPENMELARSGVLDFFGTYGISIERIEEKVERKINMWTAEDIVDLRAAATALKEGRISANELFPTESGASEETEDLGAKILNGDSEKKTPVSPTSDIRTTNAYLNFDPLKESIQKKYSKAKRTKIIDELESNGIKFDRDWPGAQLHQFLLNPPSPVPPHVVKDEDGNVTEQHPPAEPDEDDFIKLENANTSFFRLKVSDFSIWDLACRNANIENPDVGLANLDEADRFDICYSELKEADNQQ